MGDSLGKLVLRLTVGGLLLLHGMHKLLNGVAGVEHVFTAHGLPGALAYSIYIGEVVAPILVILGLFTRIGGALIVIDVIVAVLMTDMGSLLMLDPHTGGYALELKALYLFGGLSVALLGAGRFSFGGGKSRWN